MKNFIDDSEMKTISVWFAYGTGDMIVVGWSRSKDLERAALYEWWADKKEIWREETRIIRILISLPDYWIVVRPKECHVQCIHCKEELIDFFCVGCWSIGYFVVNLVFCWILRSKNYTHNILTGKEKWRERLEQYFLSLFCLLLHL